MKIQKRIYAVLLCSVFIMTVVIGSIFSVCGAPVSGTEYVHRASAEFTSASNKDGDLWTYEYAPCNQYENNAYLKFNNILDEGWAQFWCIGSGNAMDWQFGRISANSVWAGWGNYDVSRTFNAPSDGIITIGANGIIRIWDGYISADGVNIAIYKNGVKIYPQNKAWQLITNAASLNSFEPFETAIKAGDKIHFRLNKNGSEQGDQTQWDPVITYTDDEYNSAKDLELGEVIIIDESYTASAGFNFSSGGNNGSPWKYQYVPATKYLNGDYINFTFVYLEGSTGFWCKEAGSGNIDWGIGRIGVNNIYPGESAYDLSRTFVVPHDGVIDIGAAGIVQITTWRAVTDGAEIAIYKNNIKIFPGGESWQAINKNRILSEFPKFETSVKEGDELHFRVRVCGNEKEAEVNWNPAVSYTGNTYIEELDKAINPLPEPTIGKKYQASAGFSKNSNKDGDIWTYEYAQIGDYNNSAYNKYPSVWSDEWFDYWCVPEGVNIDWRFGRIASVNMFPGWGDYDISRTFTIPDDGVVSIDAASLIRIWDGYTSADGVNIAVYKNGVKIYPRDKSWQLVTNAAPLIFPTLETAVKAGDKIHFRINKNINEQGDQTQWDPVIIYKDDKYYYELDLEFNTGTIKSEYNIMQDFSAVKQGPEWYYCYVPINSNIVNMFDAAYDFGGNNLMWANGSTDWLLGAIGRGTIQPGHTSYDAALAFKAPITGNITITMNNGTITLPLNSETGRDGANVKIQSNKGGAVSNIWPSGKEWQYLSHTDSKQNSVNFEPLTLNVRKGEYIYFRVNMGAGNNWNDEVRIAPIIKYNSTDPNDAGYTDPGETGKVTNEPGVIKDLLPDFYDNFDRGGTILNGTVLTEYLNNHKNESTITLPAGIYKVTSSRLLNMFGDFSNKTIIADGVLLIVEDANYSAANFEGIRNTVIKGLTIEYLYENSGFAHSIIIWSCNDFTLKDFTLLGGSGNGIQIGGNCDGITIDRLTIKSNTKSASSISAGIEVEGGVKNFALTNSVINKVNTGVNVQSFGAVINNVEINNAINGVRLFASDVSIKHATFDKISNYGVEIIAGIQNTLVAKNIFNNSNEPAANCSVCVVGTLNTVIECNIFNNYKTAIYDDGTKTISIIENDFNGKEYPVNLKNTKIAIVNNNKYQSGENRAVYNIDNSATQIVGNEIPGDSSVTVGVDMTRLPQIDKNRFAGMERKTTIDGKIVYDYIMNAYNNGYDSVIIPPGAYFIRGTLYSAHMNFTNIKDFTVYAYGALFEFEHVSGTAFSFTKCDNMAIKGLTMDYSVVPNPQGTITAVNGNRLTFQADAGYIQDILDDKLVQYNSSGGNSAEAYRPGSDVPYADTWWNKSEITKVSDGIYTMTVKANLTVGSKVILRGRFAHINLFQNCANMKYEDVTVFGGSGFGFMESEGEGNSQLNRVAFTPGPIPIGGTEERLISTCDATHAVNMREGMKVTNCLFEKMTDDATNNCGSYGTVVSFNANSNELSYTGGPTFRQGDRALIYTLDGKLLNDTTALAVSGRKITLLDTFTLEPNAIIENASSNGNNFLYDNCLVQNNRSRGFLIKSPYGTIQNSTLKDNGMSAILISPEIADNWGECGFAWDINILNNRFIDGGFFTGSDLHSPINLTGDKFPMENPAYYNHGNILIQGNSFEGRYTKYCINANSVTGLKILENTFGEINPKASNSLIALNNAQPVINIQGAKDIEVSDNIYPANNKEKVNIGRYVTNIYGTDIGIIVSDYVTSEIYPYYNSDLGKWQIKVILKNVAKDNKTYSGKFEILSPVGITTVSSKNYPALNPGEVYELYFDVDLNKISSNAFTDIKIEYTTSNGGIGTFSKSMSFLNADFTETPVAIDGILDEKLWSKATPIDLGNGYYNGDYSKPAKEAISPDILGGICKYAWDEEYLYFSAVIKDAVHSQKNISSADIWNGDSIQLGISTDKGSIEIGFALGNDGNIYQHCWQYNNIPGGSKTGILSVDYANSKIIRDDAANTTIYEIALKWSFIAVSGADLNDGDNIGISIALNNSNGNANDRTFIEYFGGIATGQKGVNFGSLVLSVPKPEEIFIVNTSVEASVEKLTGNKNNLTIKITEEYSNGTINIIEETVSINNNAAGTYQIGDYKVYVDTKGNTQIRECYIITD